ncbi:MAG: hypothetical protein K6E62_02890 [Lachnospiraceae bacterium]|nr:hypothetical protein [Lachnospiraceae bacterium]
MIILILLATAAFIVFVYLFMTANDNLTTALINCNIENQEEIVLKSQIELNMLLEAIKREKERDGKADKKKIKKGRRVKAKIDSAQKLRASYEKGKISVLDIIPLAGYRLIQMLGWDSSTPMVKNLFNKCIQYKEKKEAMNYTVYLIATLFGDLLFGFVVGMIGLVIAMGAGLGGRSVIVALLGIGIFGFMGYLPYDAVNTTITKRKEEIEDEFPQVVSKVTLLTVAGMEVSRAWKLASASGTGTLYEEMNRVNIDLENNVPPVEAYSKFLRRCNNTYTTKLATAIIQNTQKGNSEIVSLFKSLNNESWLEHKHNARRKGEKIQGKLTFPTMLLFLGIIIMIMVPAMSGFNF